MPEGRQEKKAVPDYRRCPTCGRFMYYWAPMAK